VAGFDHVRSIEAKIGDKQDSYLLGCFLSSSPIASFLVSYCRSLKALRRDRVPKQVEGVNPSDPNSSSFICRRSKLGKRSEDSFERNSDVGISRIYMIRFRERERESERDGGP
jgi:hypothetical protein